MRRRASGDSDSAVGTNSNGGSNTPAIDAGLKYFSFKRHFRKAYSGNGTMSTFYLDKNFDKTDDGDGGGNEEPIYSNSDWYKEVGLYRDDEEVKNDEGANGK